MSEYWSGSITFTGLGSGVDFDSIIEANMNLEGYRLNQMEEWEVQWESKLEQIRGINTLMLEYRNQLQSLDSVNEFLAKTASSTDSSVLGVAASADAQEGSHNVVINQLAQNDVWSTASGWSATTDDVTSVDTTYTIQYGDDSYTLEVEAGTDIQTFCNLINAKTGLKDDVRATLVNDGSVYHLQLRGMDLGADNTITLSDSGMSGLDAADFEHTQIAQNAQLKVDGFPSEADQWIERDTNVVDDVIEGLTLSLHDTTDAHGEQVSVTTDMEAIIANIEEFISLTNEVRNALRDYENADAESGDEDAEDGDDAIGTDETTIFYTVKGNYGLDIIEQNLQDILAAKGRGFAYYDDATGYGDVYSSFASIGISTETDQNSEDFGNLVIDYEELEAALKEDPDGVACLFSGENEGMTNSTDFRFDSSIQDITKAGEYDVEYTVSGGQITSATINGNPATINNDLMTITGVSGNPEAGMVLRVDNLNDGTYGDKAYIRQGKINQTLDELDNVLSESGTLAIIEDSYEQIIADNAEAIIDEEARLERKEQRLVMQYATLESTLTQLNAQMETLESQLAQLS